MGLSTASLHLYGANLAQFAPLLPDSLLLREHNAPWLELLLPETAQGGGGTLEKLAKKLTKADPEAAALLFIYFDDEMFSCSLYRGGKKAAGCLSQESWAKLGKALDTLFGDELAGKAFRYAARCVDLEEKLRLLEESVGAALLDCAEFEPRTVPRGDGTLRAVKAREAALKKRPNQCALTELPVADWPVDWQAQLRLYQLMRPGWQDNLAADLLWGFGDPLYGIPQHPEYAVFVNYAFGPKDHFLRCKADSDQPEAIRTPARICSVVWQTPQGEPVCAYYEGMGEHGWIEGETHTVLACMAPDGSPRWRFVPPGSGGPVEFVHCSAEGIITLCANSRPYANQGARLWQLDGESGVLLRSVSIPCAEELMTLAWAEALQCFVYIANRNEIVVLNRELEEVARWPDYRGTQYLRSNIDGAVLWDQGYPKRTLQRYDLRQGGSAETTPELPTFVHAVLPDGRFLGVNEQRNRLVVFDPAGTVISQHSLKGAVTHVRCDGNRICILENRSPQTHGFVCEELFAETSFHVWRLDYA